MAELKRRDRAVDLLRGIAIIVMIMGHVGIGIESHDKYFSIWYHAWHMPVFYFISGYYFKGREEAYKGNFLYNKAKQLLVPYYIWGMINILINYLENHNLTITLQTISETLIKDPTTSGIDNAGALWFLPAFFWMNAIYFILNRIINKLPVLCMISVAAGLCGMIAMGLDMVLPFGIGAAIVGLPFMAVGDFIGQNKKSSCIWAIMNLKWYFAVPVSIVTFSLFYLNGEVNYRTGPFGNPLLAYINSLLGIIVFWNLCRFADKYSDQAKSGRKFSCLSADMIASIGVDSIIFLLLNQRIIYYISSSFTLVYILKRESLVGYYANFLLTTVIVVFICHVLGRICTKSKLLCIAVGK